MHTVYSWSCTVALELGTLHDLFKGADSSRVQSNPGTTVNNISMGCPLVQVQALESGNPASLLHCLLSGAGLMWSALLLAERH